MKNSKIKLIATAAVVASSLLLTVMAPASHAVKPQSVKKVAFFGFWKTNSFTAAVLAGVQSESASKGLTVVDLTGAGYDGAAQLKAIQDQTVKGDVQMYVILAIDSIGVANAVKDAIAKGITVVSAFTPIGPDFSTLTPQVPGMVVVAETPTSNGDGLAKMAAMACKTKKACNVAYLEGLKTLPLDNARTTAFKAGLKKYAPKAKLVAQVEGGYAPDSGKKAAQDVLQAHPEANVMVGSSQAIIGAAGVVDTKVVSLIGNGASKEAYAGVQGGTWFSCYNLDVPGIGSKSVQYGLIASRGNKPRPYNIQNLTNRLGTASVLSGKTAGYSDLG
jgi:ribose transport system substrate-binding protein